MHPPTGEEGPGCAPLVWSVSGCGTGLRPGTGRHALPSTEHGGFGLTVALDLDAPGIARDEAVDLTNLA
jgi:hypothetical protein